MKKNIIISGAGLVGSLLAVALKQKGHNVRLYEKRSDMRVTDVDGGRSINLVLTAKGIKALRKTNLLESVLKITTPVTGRMMHSKEGNLTFQPYGRDDSEHNHSVSRAELNVILLNEAQKAGVELFFNEELESIDPEKKLASFSKSKNLAYDLLFGADGAGSGTRKALLNILGPDAKSNMTPLGASYKELFMPANKTGEYAIEKKALHIWPRGSHMLMALPNLDGSFTMTLYMPDLEFAKLQTPEQVKQYFLSEYPDSVELMPSFENEFFENPTGFLGTLRCDQWVYKDQVALIGDAAHAIVPFFGQGMNCGFSDVTKLLELIEKHQDDWHSIFENYQLNQKSNSDGIADLSIENFEIMSSKVADSNFLLRKKVEHLLENKFPDIYRSRYGMVTYTLIPYNHAIEAGKIQDDILATLMQNIQDVEEVDLDLAQELIANKLTPYLKENNLSIERYS